MGEVDTRYQKWSGVFTHDRAVCVLPDGCQDLLIISRPGHRDQFRLTPFDLGPRWVDLPAGVELIGYRLRPGSRLGRQTFEAIMKRPEEAEARLLSDIAFSADTDEVIRALSLEGATLSSASRDVGVSVRSLQRYLQTQSLPGPDHWRMLARARRAANHLAAALPIAEIAFMSGYSDQAHMTRDFRRWFGATPARVRDDAELRDHLCQPGLGNWTVEQSSTRQPSGSLT